MPTGMPLLAAEWLLWLSLAGVAYIYAGYPLLVAALGRLRPLAVERRPWEGDVSVVVVACNEAHRLPAKLDSIFASHGAERIVEVLVGSDGSDDETVTVLAGYPDPRVQCVHFDTRRGKPAVLNDLIPRCRSELVILTDARQALAPDGIDRLAANFADPEVGVVSGELKFRESSSPTAAAVGMGVYWRYEKFIRGAESKFRGVPGASGAFYAIRRSLCSPLPEQTLLDDVVIPMQAVAQGYRCLLEEGAIAWDVPSQSVGQEAVRKRRTIAGCAQLVINQPQWLLPWRNPIWWEFVSHKLARLASPWLLALALGMNLWLACNATSSPAYRVLLALQVAFYLLAALAWVLHRSGKRVALLGPVLMFVSLNVTTLAALWDACRGRFRATWQRTS